MANNNTNGIAIAGAGVAVIFLYSGLTGRSILASIQAIVKGKGPNTVPPDKELQILGTPNVSTTNTEGGTPPPGENTEPGQGTSVQNIALGTLMAAGYGWVGSQMSDLVNLWTRESSWNANATNPSSGAYGIAQALGHGVAGNAAPNGTNEYGPDNGVSLATANAANGGSAAAQITWGLAYIKSTYGNPANAWAHEQSQGWY